VHRVFRASTRLCPGAFIGADPGESSETKVAFKGLESPPPITYGQKGTRFTLNADDLGQLDIGSPFTTGASKSGRLSLTSCLLMAKVSKSKFSLMRQMINLSPLELGFWNASGVDVSLAQKG
jgi:paraquat-inducible protein B